MVSFTPPPPGSQGSLTAPPPVHGKPGDVGFGYIMEEEEKGQTTTQQVVLDQRGTGLKSALKSPGAPPRTVMSPMFEEDPDKTQEMLERAEALTDKEQEKDLRIKTRVRIAKIVLRGVNFSCSLVVLSLLAATFQIFNMTRNLSSRNGLPPWSRTTPVWPQITLLVIACISLVFAVLVMWANIRHGHHRAEKMAVYYTSFAFAFFIFNIVMWGIGAAILSGSMGSQNGQDIWGWACKDNRRKELFQNEIDYSLICRLQNWALICAIIEIVIELFIISIYGFIFYRFWSKRRLRKTMEIRDRVRSDMYLAQLRQSAPNTPGLQSPRSDRFGRGPGGLFSPTFSKEMGGRVGDSPISEDEDVKAPLGFSLQPAPRTRRAAGSVEASPLSSKPESTLAGSPIEEEGGRVVHAAAAPGEQQYASVPIPDAHHH